MKKPVYKPVVKLAIANESAGKDALFGLGVATLCQGVREKGSLNAAAKSMQMAYSKAWRIMKSAEESLGVQLLNRDGAHGSTLTPAGEHIVDTYFDLCDRIAEYAEQEFDKEFNN